MLLEIVILWTLLSLFAYADEQCQNFISTGYTIEGLHYAFHCSQAYNHSQYLQITYQENITACIDICRRWDEPGTICEGVQFNHSMTGAPGFQGQQCYLLFNTTVGKMTSSPVTDIALLQNETLSSSDCSGDSSTYTSATGLIFDRFCYTDLDVQEGDIHVSYSYDVDSCAEACSDWNRDPTAVQCRAVTFDYGFWAPGESGNRSQCWLKQDGIWTGESRQNQPIHSMALQQQFWVNTTANATCPAPVVNVNGFSDGAKGGIVAAAIGGFIIGCAGMFFFRERKIPQDSTTII